MTTHEAIEDLEYIRDKICISDEFKSVCNMAIRSLEAWEKVKEEIKGDIFIYNLGLTGEKIIALIDKHLQEVEK